MTNLLIIISAGSSLLSIITLFIGAYLFDTGLMTVKGDVFVFPATFAVVALITTVLGTYSSKYEESNHVR